MAPVGALQSKRCLNSKTYNKPSNLPEVLSIPLGLRLPLSQRGFPYWGTLCKSGTKGLVIDFSLDSKSVPAIEGAWTLCLSQLKCKTLLKKSYQLYGLNSSCNAHVNPQKQRRISCTPRDAGELLFRERENLPSARSGSCCQVLDIISNLAKKGQALVKSLFSWI